MLTRIQIGMADSTPFKRRLYDYFMPRAIERERKRHAGKSPGAAERLSAFLGEFLVFGPIKDFLGMTRMHRAYTGGEAMGEDTFLLPRARHRSAPVLRPDRNGGADGGAAGRTGHPARCRQADA